MQKVDYADPAYKKINPLGMVPALDIGGSRAMTQANAILQYIADSHPAARLGAADGLEAQFEFNETMAFLTGDFHPAYWPMFSPQRYTTDNSAAAHDAVREAAWPRIDRVMSHLDVLIGTSGHVYRDRRSVADAYAYVMARWSVKTPKPYTQYPHLAAFMTRMGEDEAVKRVLAASNA
ncbi:glutathione S-transferase N-terminal domain-containing protein [Cardiobacterium hominis]|uniref:glutathione S-transferase family protein n=1 Tax=Cardiobacterium hominis TaxID=2718 RepID=UPI0028E876EF|nr:glutathione S-transferase N-terminal domain-containing protein [Cardiobacterium hominis]